MSLETTIPCQICGKELRHMATHAVRVHGLSVNEYRERFPEAPTMAEAYRKGLSMAWEDRGLSTYWTEERIIAALLRWAKRRGKPPTAVEWSRPLGVGRLGRSRSRPTASTVMKVFGTWNAALSLAGLPTLSPGPVARQPALRCKRGHLLSGENEYVRPGGSGRQCRICMHAANRRRRERIRKAGPDVCPMCGGTMVGKRSNAQVCSRRCKARAKRARLRATRSEPDAGAAP